MVRWWISSLQIAELFVSSIVHLSYGFYIFSTALARDLLQALADWTFGFGKGRLGSLSYFGGAEKKDVRVLVLITFALSLWYYPEWDEDHPIHFVGHSAGAQVVRVLQQMLAGKAFDGYENTSPNWVLSLTSLSGAFNDTTRTYLDGMQPENGKSIKPVSLLQLCRIGVILYDWFDIQWLKNYYNFGFDHFNLSRRKTGIWGLVNCLLGKTGPFASGDWILPDLTIQGSIRLNAHIQTFSDTYYFSYATKRTRKVMGVTIPSGLLGIRFLLFVRVLQMSQWRYPPDVDPPYKGYRDEDWWDNDGALNTISMTHPRFPVEHPSHFVIKDSECQPLKPGIWYYKIVEGDHILFIINRERACVQFDLIYDSIFERCRKHAFGKKPTLPNQVHQ
ncbi:alpha/beta-Hydrolases superfamily protein [Striga asiatica]|uniref:Alpha/beta-Hydrolases superfamily protein n=1 Tax=Striga asiatica TaxID=4170 RepID=A0A5A7R2H4_STRAF|nr:alpha/beta-Hydrolases superfamily protein [Striga asiatica]